METPGARFISADYGLNKKEKEFVRIYLSFREANAAEAYRRSHLKQAPSTGKWVDPPVGRPIESFESFPEWDRNKVSRAASALLKEETIQAYLNELKRPTSEIARQRIRETAAMGEEGDARAAAALILKEEDRFGVRDAARMWTEIMTDAGAEVELVLPEFIEARVLCPHCDAWSEHQVRVALKTPLAEMFKDDRPVPPAPLPEFEEGVGDFEDAD